MKTNRLIIGILACMIALGIQAKDLTGVRIYVNPGHGGFDPANDRNVVTIPFGANDERGFWESSSNLTKGLELRDLLQASGATVMMSRVLNRDQDDRGLTEIAEEASSNNMDAFISIHSNAMSENKGTNYLLIIFRGETNNPDPAEGKLLAQACWPWMFDNPLTNWSHYSSTNMNNVGDLTFYGGHLGVLRVNTVPGFLSEGQFHDYLPETHRLLSEDYRKLEAHRFYRFYCDYFGADLPEKGIIAGTVKSGNERMNDPLYLYRVGTNDQWKPLNGAKVELYSESGSLIDTYTTDDYYNGVYVFFDIDPGTYTIKVSMEEYEESEFEVTVEAGLTTSTVTLIDNENILPSRDPIPDYIDPEQEAGAIAIPFYKTREVSKVSTGWLDELNIRKTIFRDGKLYVLTTDPKLYVVNPATGELIQEMSLTGIQGGILPLSDIAFTADGYLLGCNKESIVLSNSPTSFKVYIWEDDEAEPELFFTSTQQGNWNEGVVGEAMAVTGPSWRCRVFTSAVTVGSSKQVRVLGYEVDEDVPGFIGYKYRMNGDTYSELLWGDTYNFTISPVGKDRIIVESEKILPVEYGFNWEVADREPMLEYGSLAAEYLHPIAQGSGFFKYAGHSFMVTPTCKEDGKQASAVLFDITEGVGNALKISDHFSADGIGTDAVGCMMAAGVVSGYDINFYVFAQNQGLARYSTVTTDPVANIYASELKLSQTDAGYNFSFVLNENATGVLIEFTVDGEVKGSYDVGSLDKGKNSVSIDKNDIPVGENVRWQVRATAESVARPIKMTGDEVQLQYYNTHGVAVDNNPESPYFGRVYVTSCLGGPVTNRTTDQGIYILDALLADVTNQGEKSYDGGITWAASNSPFRVSVAPDGRVFMTDWSDANSGIFIMDPANPGNNFIRLFDGLTYNGDGLGSKGEIPVHGSISSCYLMGEGEDLKLFTFDEDYLVNGKPGNVLQYNIGNATTWTDAPSEVLFENAATGGYIANMNCNMLPDGRGGWWISQYRATDQASVPSLIHYNGTSIDFNSGRATPSIVGNSRQAGMAISLDGSKIAMGCSNEIKILGVSYNEEGVPSIELLHSIAPALGANSNGLAFDWAGNVYLVSNTNERLGMWSLPKADNTVVTPAPSAQILSGEKIGGVKHLESKVNFNEVTLTWDIPDGLTEVTAYKVYRGEELLNTITETTFVENDMDNGTYWYHVTAVHAVGETDRESIEVTVAMSCGPVTALEKQIVDETNLTLTWRDPEGITATATYNVYLSDELVENVNGPTYSVNDLQEGTYLYGITAVYGNYETAKATIEVVIEIDKINLEQKVTKVYPNPTDGWVEVESEELISSLEVYDMNGRLIYKEDQPSVYKISVDFSEYASGTYILKINNQTMRIIRK